MSLMKLTKGTKKYEQDTNAVYALDNVDVEVNNGEIVVILGASGSGKTTLLNILAGLDQLDAGEYMFHNTPVNQMNRNKITELRKKHFGFIFQSYHLLENLDVLQNVKIGTILNKASKNLELSEIIRLVGLEDKKKSNIYELSGGEQQRVAIARALAKKPEVLFCDEPTGALDEQTSKEILKLMIDLNEQLKTTIILVTHNPIIANIADKILIMRDGRIEEQLNNGRKDILHIDWSLV